MTIVWKALKPILVAVLQVYETTLIPEMEADLDFLRSVASMINMMIQVSLLTHYCLYNYPSLNCLYNCPSLSLTAPWTP